MPRAAIVRLAKRILCVCALLALPQPGAAQSLEEVDRLVEASAKPGDGLTLARSQAGSGEWLDALATLDRVLAIEPKHKQARLLHASLLCNIDDPDGAKVEFARLKAGDFKKADWKAALEPCRALAEAAK